MTADRQPSEGAANPARADRAPCLLKAESQTPNWDLRDSDKPGTHRAICAGLAGTSFAAAILVVPEGQGSNPHAYTAEHILYQLEGTTEITLGDESWRIEPGDLFYMPAYVEYVYRNVGSGTVRQLSVTSRVDDWPGRVAYPGSEPSLKP
jgi:mannose-6-phosphate isomerase-like protein (cupin superfamily)